MSFVSLLRRHYWVIKTLGIALAAAFAGSAVMTTLATRAMLGTGPALPEGPEDDPEAREALDDERPVTTGSKALHPSEQASQEILAYNVFCPTCVPAGEASTPPVAAIADAPVTGLSMKLVATMESTDPAASLATFYDPGGGTTGIYGVGDFVASGAVVDGIGAGFVTVAMANGTTALLRVGETPKPTPPPPPASSSSPSTTSRARSTSSAAIPGAADAISCSGSTCVVERELVESLMSDPSKLATQAAVRPTSKGFQLSRVRSGSLPALLGLRTGDILTEVNGQSLDSLEDALDLATKLRHATNLRVTVSRGGKTVRKEIQIS